jgi:hypothetical protein
MMKKIPGPLAPPCKEKKTSILKEKATGAQYVGLYLSIV